jgi:hypothetical protein
MSSRPSMYRGLCLGRETDGTSYAVRPNKTAVLKGLRFVGPGNRWTANTALRLFVYETRLLQSSIQGTCNPDTLWYQLL